MFPVLFFFFQAALASSDCKLTPSDSDWPSQLQWAALNSSIDGVLLKVHPSASSCYPGNPLGSSIDCNTVESNWTESSFHASLPESIASPVYANNSCLPPGAPGYIATKGCALGGYPSYVVNATTEEQIAVAVKWASSRNIRIVVKGTGHDLNGRSSGAHSLSIWTHQLSSFELVENWTIPGSNDTDTVLFAQTGLNYGQVVGAALDGGRVIVSGNDATVGPGGHLQGGGHGPLSSTYGLASDNLYQARVVTTQGDVLTVDATQNQDLLWAIRGGGAGQYGIVTQYVLRTHVPPTITTPGFTIQPAGNSSAAYEASWKALAVLLHDTPDLMDAGLAGAIILRGSPKAGVTVSQGYYAYNMNASAADALIKPTVERLRDVADESVLSIVQSNTTTPVSYRSFFDAMAAGGSSTTGALTMISSRLLGRAELSDISQEKLTSYTKRMLEGRSEDASGFVVIGLQGGPGPAKVDKAMRGSLPSSWRTAYVHAMSYNAYLDATLPPKEMLSQAAASLETTTEKLWREWAPDMGSYMNEGNPFNSNFKKDFYGDSYDELLKIKKKYDPTESLYVLSGVGSDAWDYDLGTGKLCKV